MRHCFGRSINAFVFLLCLSVIGSLILGSVAEQRVAARRTACSDQLRKMGLGFQNYHSAFRQLPPGTGGTTANTDKRLSNAGRLGPLVAILPFVEEQPLWETVANPYPNATSSNAFPAMGPVPWFDSSEYLPWSQGPAIYRCPDNFRVDESRKPTIIYSLQQEGGSNVTASYVACFGDGTYQQGSHPKMPLQVQDAHQRRTSMRGAFMTGQANKFRDFLDGLSNTVFYSEAVASEKRLPGQSELTKNVAGLSQNPSLCLSASKKSDAQFWKFGRGSRWCHGIPIISGFQTVLPPNSPSCTSDLGIDDCVTSASSLHPDGVYTLLADGAVFFASNSIDTGDTMLPGVALGDGYTSPGSKSPYGVWGALGSRAAREPITVALDYVSKGGRISDKTQDSADAMPTWTDKTGKIRLTAEFIEIKDRKLIRLRSASGDIHEVPLNSLSDSCIRQAVEFDLAR